MGIVNVIDCSNLMIGFKNIDYKLSNYVPCYDQSIFTIIIEVILLVNFEYDLTNVLEMLSLSY